MFKEKSVVIPVTAIRDAFVAHVAELRPNDDSAYEVYLCGVKRVNKHRHLASLLVHNGDSNSWIDCEVEFNHDVRQSPFDGCGYLVIVRENAGTSYVKETTHKGSQSPTPWAHNWVDGMPPGSHRLDWVKGRRDAAELKAQRVAEESG